MSHRLNDLNPADPRSKLILNIKWNKKTKHHKNLLELDEITEGSTIKKRKQDDTVNHVEEAVSTTESGNTYITIKFHYEITICNLFVSTEAGFISVAEPVPSCSTSASVVIPEQEGGVRTPLSCNTTTTDDNFPNFLTQFDSTLNSLLRNDPILSDLADSHLTVESIESQLAFECGQGVRINLKREDGSILPILIKKNETVRGLMKRIQTETERELKNMSEKRRNIHWRLIWRQNWLVVVTSDGEQLKLTNDKARLIDVGLVNNTEIRFSKKLRDKKPTSQLVKKKKINRNRK